MVKYSYLVFLWLFASSCQFFETEKVSSEEIFDQEIKTIDWKDVDRYPSFANCESALEKPEQKACFINTISTRLQHSISAGQMIAVRQLRDTVKVYFEVNSNGHLSILSIKMDTVLQKEFPHLQQWIVQSIDSLRPVAPAYKRGIPVRTQFTLPVIIETN